MSKRAGRAPRSARALECRTAEVEAPRPPATRVIAQSPATSSDAALAEGCRRHDQSVTSEHCVSCDQAIHATQRYHPLVPHAYGQRFPSRYAPCADYGTGRSAEHQWLSHRANVSHSQSASGRAEPLCSCPTARVRRPPTTMCARHVRGWISGSSTAAFPRRVRMVTPMSRPDLRCLLDDSSCLVLPSRSEGLARIAIEAMARGRAVVATHVGGIDEFIIDGHSGRVVAAKDARALAEA